MSVSPEHDLRGVLRVEAFRRLWTALSLSSLGDWLGLLALTALAPRLADGGYVEANLAIAGVFILRLAPAILVGPLAGVVADRFNRRATMVVCDFARFALFLSIPAVGTLWWLFVATLLIEVASLMWIPAKEATIPNLVPRERLETANQLSLFTTYGSAPVAAALFAGLALLSGMLDNAMPSVDEVDLALYVNAATFLVSGWTILRLRNFPARELAPRGDRPGVWSTLVEGWRYVGRTPLVRGLVIGMLGAFAAGGAVIGLARTFVTDLGAGDPGYGLLFGTVFLGLAAGMFLGPRLLPDLSRRRLFGLAILMAGLSLALLALVPHIVFAVIVTLVIGAFAGVAWVTGYTLLGLEVADELRGRTFAFVQTMVRVVLVLVLAVAPLLAAAFGQHRIRVTDAMVLPYHGAAITFLLAGLLAAGLGFASYRHLDDRRGVPLRADLAAAFHSEAVGRHGHAKRLGYFIALEGGEGAGKSTQATRLAEWLTSLGHDVVVTHEPGGTDVGRRLRSVLLDHPDDSGESLASRHPLSPRAEALLFAADRAEHVATVIAPALAEGQIVITDRYTDSSVAYQGAGRDLAPNEVGRLSRWATDGLVPDLTVLLDLPAAHGLARVDQPDRLESEPVAFHERVRQSFLEIARKGGARYLVLDATRPAEEITEAVRSRVQPALPMTATQRRELEAVRQAEEEQRRVREAVRRLEEARAKADAEEAARRKAAEERDAAERRAAEERAAAERRAAEEREEARRRAIEAEEAAQRRALEEQERARREAIELEERRARAAVEAEEQARLAATAAAERAAQEQQLAASRAERAEQRRRLKADQRRAREEAQRRRPEPRREAPRNGDGQTADDTTTVPLPTGSRSDDTTRELSLADELFGGFHDDDEDDDPDRTVHLPLTRRRGDRR